MTTEYVPLSMNEFGNTYNSATARYDAAPALTTWAQNITLNKGGGAQKLCKTLQDSLEQVKNASN